MKPDSAGAPRAGGVPPVGGGSRDRDGQDSAEVGDWGSCGGSRGWQEGSCRVVEVGESSVDDSPKVYCEPAEEVGRRENSHQ